MSSNKINQMNCISGNSPKSPDKVLFLTSTIPANPSNLLIYNFQRINEPNKG